MNKGQVFLFLVCSSLCLSYSAHGHPVHATFAEAQWNPKTFELELSLRVRGIDLESAISKTTNQKVDSMLRAVDWFRTLHWHGDDGTMGRDLQPEEPCRPPQDGALT